MVARRDSNLRAIFYPQRKIYQLHAKHIPSKNMDLKKTPLAGLILLLLILSGCDGARNSLYQQMNKIDAHAHIRTEDPAIMEFARSEGFGFVTINTGASSQEHIDMQMQYAKKVQASYPEDILYITTFSMEGFESENWTTKVIDQLKTDFEEGADGVKVWKDIGMTFRDSLGEFILIDDPLFDPIFEYIAREGKPVVAHIGEPRNCWLPLDSMTVNNDKAYFRDHPQYHMFLHPEYPSYETLIASRDHLLAKHPDLKLIGAHLGSLEWNVDELAERLDKYPNFAVDMAARVCHFQVQDREKVRDFITKYQDRLLYATDIVISPDSDLEERINWLRKEWRSDWDYFSGKDSLSSPHVDRVFQGLELDKKVLEKIYYSNAVNWYPGVFR